MCEDVRTIDNNTPHVVVKSMYKDFHPSFSISIFGVMKKRGLMVECPSPNKEPNGLAMRSLTLENKKSEHLL